MPDRNKSIPLHQIAHENAEGVFMGEVFRSDLENFRQADIVSIESISQSHRDDYYLFFLLQEGSGTIDVDFQRYEMRPSTVFFICPNQVHRIIDFKNATGSFWAMNREHVRPEYRTMLEDLSPVKPLTLQADAFHPLNEALMLSLKLSERKYKKPFTALLIDTCNVLVGLVSSQYAEFENHSPNTRFEIVTKAFKSLLEHNFITAKRPTEYAQLLHITTPYLNECVKHVTGFPVSHHIQQRVILEAKRLLYHSDMSVKEIAFSLGYDDYPYFSRLFTKVAGISALSFRNKNFD